MRVLVAPDSLKGVLSATEAASALAAGLRAGGAEAVEMPIADGGEGTLDALYRSLGGIWRRAGVHDAFGRYHEAQWLSLPSGIAAVEAAQAIPLDPRRLDPMAASSRGFGELILSVGHPAELLIGLGGSATVDGGVGLRETLHELPAPTRVACDVNVPLLDAARLFAAQKGATPAQVRLLEDRLAGMQELQPYAELPGSGAAGGLGSAFAAMGADLVPGALLILSLIGFEPRGFDLVVTGEGCVDETTARGKAPGAVLERCRESHIRCAVFGGRVVDPLPGADTFPLSGDPNHAREDLAKLGVKLAVELGRRRTRRLVAPQSP